MYVLTWVRRYVVRRLFEWIQRRRLFESGAMSKGSDNTGSTFDVETLF
jgi:hypothetical protein